MLVKNDEYLINSVDFDFAELSQLINLNSYTKNKKGVDDNAVIFGQWMKAIGYSTDVYEREHIGNHVHYKSTAKPGKKLLLLGHFDTVFPPGTFETFSQDEQWVYGPGVCDMKGGNYIALTALRNIYQAFGHINNIDVLMVSDEETGSDDSKYLTATLSSDYDYCMVFEAAGPNHDVVISRKGIATYKIAVEGKAAHAGNHYSDGINANLAAAKMLIALTELTDLERGTTINVGKMKGGIGANTISPLAELIVEARFTQSNERDRVLKAFDNITSGSELNGASISISGGLQRDVMQPSDNQDLFIKNIETILDQSLILEKRGGVSDANVVSAAGVPTLDGFGPFGDGDHTIHERALKSSFVRRTHEVTKILAEFMNDNFKY